MVDKTFLWIEDRAGKASFVFWKTMMRQLYPDVIVESKKNSSELVKAVKALTDQENYYIIVFDNSFDNVQACKERKILKDSAVGRGNLHLLDLICFEYTLLEFDKLISWIYATDDEFLQKRSSIIYAREKLVESISLGDMNYKALREVMDYDKNVNDHNIEQLSARLLFDLTRNTGFEVSKGRIGECWIKSCCEWQARENNDLCGLDDMRLCIADKMKSIYDGTSLHIEFMEAGLEVS